jgi:hypothetical protein
MLPRAAPPLAIAAALLLGATDDERATEAAVAHLRRAAASQHQGGSLLLLSSLRQMRDPSLKSYFLQLARHGDLQGQVHAVLGLAEIDPAGVIDPWLISQLGAPEAQYAAIDNALQLKVIDTPRIKELLGWDDLEPRSRALLYAALVARGEPIDRSAVAALAGSTEPIVTGLGACVLAQLGDAQPLMELSSKMDPLPGPRRIAVLFSLLGAIDAFRLTGTIDWIAALLEEPALDENLEAEALWTALRLDPGRGAALWAGALGADPAHGRAVRYGLMLLAASKGVPPSAFDALPAGDPLVDGIAAAGRAVAAGSDAPPAIITLLEFGHAGAARAAMQAAEGLDPSAAARVYGHVIDGTENSDPRKRAVYAEAALSAADRLFKIEPQAVLERLDLAADDGLTQQTILMALLDVPAPEAGAAARRLRRVGSGRADSLTLLVIARHDAQLSPEELHQLGVIAAGGGLVSEVLQVQAGWLYLKATGRIDQALAQTFTGASGGGGGGAVQPR